MSGPRKEDRKGGLASDLFRFFLVGFVFLALALLLRHGLGSDVRLRIQELRQLLQGSELAGGLWASGSFFVLLGGRPSAWEYRDFG